MQFNQRRCRSRKRKTLSPTKADRQKYLQSNVLCFNYEQSEIFPLHFFISLQPGEWKSLRSVHKLLNFNWKYFKCVSEARCLNNESGRSPHEASYRRLNFIVTSYRGRSLQNEQYHGKLQFDWRVIKNIKLQSEAFLCLHRFFTLKLSRCSSAIFHSSLPYLMALLEANLKHFHPRYMCRVEERTEADTFAWPAVHFTPFVLMRNGSM